MPAPETTANPLEASSQHPVRLGYACAWWHPREPTWSYSATRLRSALNGPADIVDLDAQRSMFGKVLLRGLYGAVRAVPWQYSAPERRLRDRAVRRGVRREQPDAVLGVADVDTGSSVPTFLYQDVNFAADIAVEEQFGVRTDNLLPSSRSLRRRRAEDQLERARAATGVFAMSHWYRDFLVARGVSANRITVVYAGINHQPTAYRDPGRPPSGRLLFVGTAFHRKGGDLVIEAVRRLNAAGDRSLRLTVAGPRRWPLTGNVPAFVDFRGNLAGSQVSSLYGEHDLFVMPSRVEAFGIALNEALIAGLPCIGRRRCAMPELIEEGVTGALVDTDDPDELATKIDGMLNDERVFERVAGERATLQHRFNWHAAAAAMVRHIDATLGR